MYKRRDVAIAELVANAWDAGASTVRITIPSPDQYEQDTSEVVVSDNGFGMSADQVDNEYLVIGRNRRTAGQPPPAGRKVMGRKGVGKLAGFGLGRRMQVTTWRDSVSTTFELDGQALKADGGVSKELTILGVLSPVSSDVEFSSGTRVSMRSLKHKTPPDVDALHRSLARRFSRTVVGEMRVFINGESIREPVLNLNMREPSSGETLVELPDGATISYWAGFSGSVLPAELQGFTILVNGKTAQAPPYFFGVEGTASGQHGTKYLTGVIEADFLDAESDDESDRISTDRQEIDWEDETTTALKAWGDATTRRLLRKRLAQRGEQAKRQVLDDPALRARLDHLDGPSRQKAERFIESLGGSDTPAEKIISLSDTIIQAFEYRQFHDYIEELDEASQDPEELAKAVTYIRGWRMLESRALLEVIKGRIEIIEKFFSMIVNDAPETAHVRGQDNVHDLIGRYPWLLNPEWQILSEETTITKQLQVWGAKDTPVDDRSRYDFLALTGQGQTVVIEMKRAGHGATLEDLHQLERYVNKLADADPSISGVFISADKYALPERTYDSWKLRNDIVLLRWADVHKRVAGHYGHYKAVLERDLTDDHFSRKAREVQKTREVLAAGTAYREIGERREGLGAQDADHSPDGDATGR